MAQTRKRHTAEFKRKVALEAIKGEKALEGIETAFSNKGKQKDKAKDATINELHRQLGQVIAERDWLRKKPLP